VRVKGKEEAVELFELVGEVSALTPTQIGWLDRFAEALAGYESGDWIGAESRFRSLLQEEPGDRTTVLYLNRIAELTSRPPDPDWTPVTRYDQK
jgi:hypothetical protein